VNDLFYILKMCQNKVFCELLIFQ